MWVCQLQLVSMQGAIGCGQQVKATKGDDVNATKNSMLHNLEQVFDHPLPDMIEK